MAEEVNALDGGGRLDVEEWGDLYVFRPIGAVFVRVLLNTPITPNQITFVRMGVAVVAMFLLSFNYTKFIAAAALCIFLGGVLDATDGQLARARRTSNPVGLVLDDVADFITFVAVNIGMFLNLVSHDFGDARELELFALMAVSASLGGIYFTQIDYQMDRAGKLTGTKDPRLHGREEFDKRLTETESKMERGILLGYRFYCRIQDYFASDTTSDDMPAWPRQSREAEVASTLLQPLLRQWMCASISIFLLAATLATLAAIFIPAAFFYFFCIVAPLTGGYFALMIKRTMRVDQAMKSEGILPPSQSPSRR